MLDVGCRGFEFDHGILALRPKARIIALDPDPIITQPEESRIEFHRKAMTERQEGKVWWQGPGEGAYIAGKPGDPGYGWGVQNQRLAAAVENCTIKDFGDRFDLVKLDCEGSEFGILENWPGPIAKQISVEFHDFINRQRWNDAYFEKLFAGPLRDYSVVKFEVSPIGPANSLGHWDSLLVIA